ncbi:MAG: hypothetical protein EPO26_13680 [Chloroflexota bacterium]|nr:MAG: hypothetical protein EPO26_13680 [Chloroflexota bacterium]
MSDETIGRCSNGHTVCRVRGLATAAGDDARRDLVVRATCHACGRPTVRSIDRESVTGDGPRMTRLTCSACDTMIGFTQTALRRLFVHCHQCPESAVIRLGVPSRDGDDSATESETLGPPLAVLRNG